MMDVRLSFAEPLSKEKLFSWHEMILASRAAKMRGAHGGFTRNPCRCPVHLSANIVSALEPDLFSPLLIWKNFLQSGGRYALGLVMGVAAIAAARKNHETKI